MKGNLFATKKACYLRINQQVCIIFGETTQPFWSHLACMCKTQLMSRCDTHSPIGWLHVVALHVDKIVWWSLFTCFANCVKGLTPWNNLLNFHIFDRGVKGNCNRLYKVWNQSSWRQCFWQKDTKWIYFAGQHTPLQDRRFSEFWFTQQIGLKCLLMMDFGILYQT